MACPYCHLVTPAGVAAQQREAQAAEAARAHGQWMAAAQLQTQEVERRRIQGTATQSLIWSIAGVVLCCLPLGVVGIVQGLRARSASLARAFPVPGTAKVGLWLGIASCLTSIGFFTWAAISASNDEARARARAAEIDRLVGARAQSATLESSVACQLAEARTLQSGWDNRRGYTFDRFECPGRLTQTGDVAQLEDFRFHATSEEVRVFVCFKRGARWYVDTLSATSCAH